MNIRMPVSIASRLTPVRLFFDQTRDEQFLVLAEILFAGAPGLPGRFSVHTFEHEDHFLERVGATDLSVADMSLLAVTVMKSVNGPAQNLSWIELRVTNEQLRMLGLEDGQPAVPAEAVGRIGEVQPPSYAFEFDNSGQFYQFLMSSPTPFTMLSGPEHRFTFINQAYVELIGKTTQEEILMKTLREVLPELEGQPFFGWMDEVYETGVQLVRKNQRAHIRRQHGFGFEDRYFDFVYYPVRNATGHVYGVMVQAADVTESVRMHEVSEEREARMFQQWAEIEAVYRTAPIGMALLEAGTLRLLRLNEKQADLMGSPVGELMGKRVLELKNLPDGLEALFAKLAAGGSVRNVIVEKKTAEVAVQSAGHESGHRTWLMNISPFLGASGEVMAYTCTALEVPDNP
jgi:PAS domain-containing protein